MKDANRVAPLRRALAAALAAFLAAYASPDGVAGDPARGMRSECDTEFVVVGGGVDYIEVLIIGVCQSAHLGRAHSVANQRVTFSPAGEVDSIVSDVTTTAANGDQLHSTFAGAGAIAADGSVEFSGTETYVGGTGRFGKAAGASALVGVAQFISPGAGFGWFSTRGRITY